MKRNINILTILLFTLISCTNDVDYVTCNSDTPIRTRATNTETTWTDLNTCILNGNKEVSAPWTDLSLTIIPNDIRKDVKEEDGWDILFSTVEIKNYTRNYNYNNLSENANYIIFYNKYSGFLKGFCYIDQDVAQNNCGVWQLTVNGTTKLFNFVGENAVPYDGTEKHGIYTTNITDESQAGGFTRGWNCFMVELSYDANSITQTLNISGISLDQATYDFSSTMMFNTSGSYITTAQSPYGSLISGVASAAGEGAKSIISSWEASQQNSRSAIGSLAAAGVSTLVSNGLNKIFKSLTGSTGKVYHDITLTSKGNATVNGNSQQPSSGIVPPLSGIALNGLGYNLGVWNLSTSPQIQIERNWKLDGNETNLETYYKYSVFSRQIYNVVINPIISSYSTSADMLFTSIGFPSGYIYNSSNFYANNHVYGDTYNYPSLINVVLPGILPNGSSEYNLPCFNWERANHTLVFEGALSVKNIVYSPNGNFYSTHTFNIDDLTPASFSFNGVRPYTWTHTELKNKGYVH